MKRIVLAGATGFSLLGAAHGEGLYAATNPTDTGASNAPVKWTVGVNFIYDDNINPTYINPLTGTTQKQDSVSVNPYASASFSSKAGSTTLEVFARVGLNYYFDSPVAPGSDDVDGQARLELNLTHEFNERLRFVSRNFVAYEKEPDYAYGYASSAQVGEYFFWQTDNSIGYRFTERFATYTGITLEGINYDSSVPNSDRFTWTAYEQFRYQATPQSVLTLEYRYGQTTGNGVASDATDQYLLLGIEHRLTPTTIIIAKAGAQFHDADTLFSSESTVSPYAELSLNSQINTQFSVRAFARYSIENYDDVRSVFGPRPSLAFPNPLINDEYAFSERKTFRLGVSGNYAISPKLNIFGGVDYIPSSFDKGELRTASYPGPASVSGLSEDLVNVYLGFSVKLTDVISGDVSYNYTDATSDLIGNSYTRNRVNVGLRANF